MRRRLISVLCLLWLCSPASAGPAREAALPDVCLTDLDDRPVPLRSFAGKVLVLVHEDRESSGQNQALKDRLGQLQAERPGRLALVALAEVSAYNFWPARRYVKAALSRVRAEGALVLCDWSGVLRKRFALRSGQGALILIGRDGQLALLRRGELGSADAAALLRLVEQLTDGKPDGNH